MSRAATLLAKPIGVPLIEHRANVLAEAEHILNARPFLEDEYRRRTQCNLREQVRQSAWHHDDGKEAKEWAKCCNSDFEEYLKTGKDKGAAIRQANFRHEIQSLVVNEHRKFSDPVKVAIAAHHGKLSLRHEHRWDQDKQLRTYFFQTLNHVFDSPTFTKAVLDNYRYAGPRALLKLADERASAKENWAEKKTQRFQQKNNDSAEYLQHYANAPLPAFDGFNYHFNENWTPRAVQLLAQANWEEELLLMRAPTGAGKTDAALLWAKKQIEEDKADRLVIALPTRFTSNALVGNLAAEASINAGLYHSSARFMDELSRSKDEREKEQAKQSLQFARMLLAPVTVCTIDHLLMAFTHTREDHHGITFNLANSCLVIDEADFYDDFTQQSILIMLKALKVLQVPVMLMSASLPNASLIDYQSTGYKVEKIFEDTSDNERIRCNVESIQQYAELSEIEELLEKAIHQPTIIYANTVASAFRFFDWYKAKGFNPILYHSQYLEPDKLHKEAQLLNQFGKEAWKAGNAHGIAILTQIGELSINISADLMITELCPIDRLVQRVGRLSRFQPKGPGTLHILKPIKSCALYPAPYGEYSRSSNTWAPSPYLLKTMELLKPIGYSAQGFVDLINEVYDEPLTSTTKAKENANLYEELIKNNWLILPNAQTQPDDEETGGNSSWKARNIDRQVKVFIGAPQANFHSMADFKFFEATNTVSIRAHITKGKENVGLFKPETVNIYDEKEKATWIDKCYYSKDFGLRLDKKSHR